LVVVGCALVACSIAQDDPNDKLPKPKQNQSQLEIVGLPNEVDIVDKYIYLQIVGGDTNNVVSWSIVDIDREIATIDANGKVSLHGVGVFRVRAIMPGNDLYRDVSTVSDFVRIVDTSEETLVIEKQDQEPLVLCELKDEYEYDATFGVSVSGGSIQVSYAIELSVVGSDSVAILVGNTVHIVGVGDFRIGAYKQGDEYYNDVFVTSNPIAATPKKVSVVDVVAVDKYYDGTIDVATQGGSLDIEIPSLDFEIEYARAVTADVGQDIPVEIGVQLVNNDSNLYVLACDIVYSTVNILPVKLDAPIVTQLQDTRWIEWDTVAFATQYKIIVDTTQEYIVDVATRYMLDATSAAKYTITVVATTDSANYIDSEVSNEIVLQLVRLDVPQLTLDKDLALVNVLYDADVSIVECSIDGINYSTDALPVLGDTTNCVYARALPVDANSLYVESDVVSHQVIFLPRVDDVGVEQYGNDFELSWSRLQNAIGYNVYVDNEWIGYADCNTYHYNSTQGFVLKIQAVGNDWTVSSVSQDWTITHQGLMGQGTQDDPYEIYCYTDLLYINDDNCKYYALMQDITLPDGFELDGLDIVGFDGVFDGRGNNIYNIGSNRGLFGTVGHNGVVANLNVHLNIDTDKDTNVGGIASVIYGTVRDVRIHGSIIAQSASNVGGIAGIVEGATVYNVANHAVVEGNGNVGGIAGNARDSIVAFVYNQARLTGSNTGGILGLCDNSTVLGSYNTGDLYAMHEVDKVGGIVGSAIGKSVIVGNYNLGHILSNKSVKYTEGNGILGYSDDAVAKNVTVEFNIYLHQDNIMLQGMNDSLGDNYRPIEYWEWTTYLPQLNSAILNCHDKYTWVEMIGECFDNSDKLWWEEI
jgi:hypothetical protein